jgi:chaperone modulatory protein CbpM
MIVEFRRDLAIDDEAMPVVLGLVDRLHAARAALQTVLEAVASLPSPQQDAVLRQIRATPGSWAPDAYQSTAK